MFKHCSSVICPVICELFNASLTEGRFPDCLKTAQVIPVYKSGDRLSVKCYRPISLLPSLAKIFEKLMRSRLVTFLDDNGVLSKHQFGFRSGRSTGDAVSEFLDYAYRSLDVKEYFLAVYLDFSKAFDTIDHDVLLSKMCHLGVGGLLLQWFRSFLTDRMQFVGIGERASEELPITFGVPQGSVLAPVLFLLYINDMSVSSGFFKYVHFADDTTVFASGKDIRLLADVVNRGLADVDVWLRCNKISLNIDKTAYMIISDGVVPDDIAINIRGTTLSCVHSTKFLGVIIDDKLTFNLHIEAVCKKVSRTIGMIYRIANCVPPHVLRNLYFTLVHSLIVYGITSWGSSAQSHLERLFSLQRRFIKLLPVHGNRFSLKHHGILDVGNLYKYCCCVQFFKSFKLGNHDHFLHEALISLPDHNYPTRHRLNGNFNTPLCNKSRRQRSYFFKSVTFWNALPDVIRDCESGDTFKSCLKVYLLDLQAQ